MLHHTRPLVVSILIGLLTACGGGGGDGGGTTPAPQVPDAVPTGYYDNRGTGTLNSTTVTDLQGIIHNNRLMMLSATAGLSYDGSITVSGNNYSGTLSVYDDGTLVGTAPVTGTITQGTSVSGTLTGTGAGSGSFQLLYAASNSETAALGRVEDTTNPYWEGPIGGSVSKNVIAINSGGNLLHAQAAFDGTFDGCNIYGTIAPIAATNLYTVTIVFDTAGCINPDIITNNNYTGLATTRQRTTADDTLVMIATNGSYSVATDFVR